MLTWYPDRRATAQEMLEHPWLKMPRNDDFKLSDSEYEKMMIVIKEKEEIEKKKKELEIILREGSMDPETLSKKIRSENMSELAESLPEKNGADFEDLDMSQIVSDEVADDEESISLGFEDPDAQEYFLDEKLNRSLDDDAAFKIKTEYEEYNMFEGGGYGKGKPLNNSFTGPYNNMEHIHVDRGANAQF